MNNEELEKKIFDLQTKIFNASQFSSAGLVNSMQVMLDEMVATLDERRLMKSISQTNQNAVAIDSDMVSVGNNSPTANNKENNKKTRIRFTIEKTTKPQIPNKD